MIARESADELAPGDLVSAYRIEGQIGSGGMGWVYRASHALRGHAAALKVMRKDQLDQSHSIDRMLREATILASVSHPGLPQFFELGLLADGRPWIAMELITGTSLHARLAYGALPVNDVRAVVRGVASVLAAAHARGVTHRDLKPENIFLTLDDRHPVRVIDWGIAQRRAGERYTNHNEAIGTPTYMSPEQARGITTDGYSDVYGLGVVAYHALTGKPPFTGASSVEVLVQHLNKSAPPLAPRCPNASPALVSLVERMLAKSTTARPAAGQIVVELDAMADEDAGGGDVDARAPLSDHPDAITQPNRAATVKPL